MNSEGQPGEAAPKDRQRARVRRASRFRTVGSALLAVAGLFIVWRLSPLYGLASPEDLRATLDAAAATPTAPLVVLAVFVVAGIVFFPTSVLVVITSATFGLTAGLLYSASGLLAGAALGYLIGRWVGRDGLKRIVGTRVNRVARGFARKGILTIATIRLLPFAPYGPVNLIAGATRVRFTDFMLGTVLGKLPGLIIMSLLGEPALEILIRPTVTHVVLLALYLLAWLLLSVLVQHLIERNRRSLVRARST